MFKIYHASVCRCICCNKLQQCIIQSTGNIVSTVVALSAVLAFSVCSSFLCSENCTPHSLGLVSDPMAPKVPKIVMTDKPKVEKGS